MVQLAVCRAVRVNGLAVAHDEVERRGLRAPVRLDVLDRFPDAFDDASSPLVDMIQDPLEQPFRVRLPLYAVAVHLGHDLREVPLRVHRAVVCEDVAAVEEWVSVLRRPGGAARLAYVRHDDVGVGAHARRHEPGVVERRGRGLLHLRPAVEEPAEAPAVGVLPRLLPEMAHEVWQLRGAGALGDEREQTAHRFQLVLIVY